MVAPHRLPCETPDAHKPSDLAAQTTRWVLPATILGSSMTFIDGSVVTIAMPAIQAELRAGTEQIQWIADRFAGRPAKNDCR